MTDCALTVKATNSSCFAPDQLTLITKYTDSNALAECKDDDKCMLEKSKLADEVKEKIKREAFKAPVESFDHNYWLNNTQIDTVMSQLRLKHPGFAHGFIHMIDLKSFSPTNVKSFDYPVHPVTEIDFSKEIAKALHEKGIIKDFSKVNETKLSTYDDTPLHSFGVICNTDSSKGSGQHWFTIFISTDQKDPDDTSKPWIRIECFNSGGGSSDNEEFNAFWEKTASEISKETGLKCTYDTITYLAHQSSDTGNCGSYSLFYIYSRLNGVHPDEFNNPKKPIKDYAMQKFRKVCFRIDKEDNIF